MSASSIAISDAFDGGNIEHVSTDDSNSNSKVLLRIKPDPFTELEKINHLQYFSFRARVPATSSVEYVIENAGKCSYPSACYCLDRLYFLPLVISNGGIL
mmetsp:Transcript_24876/g.38470  ORF Transcript_24876/g.38470 Transcript_24876/m.38470 type:complete len:100 (-) Transcript_24876:898-1197(-)